MAEPQTREQIPEEARWDLSKMYETNESWEAAFAALQSLPETMEAWKGRLGESAETLAEALTAMFEAYRKVEQVYVYAHLRHDEDLGESLYHDMYERARKLYHQMQEAVAYFDPELLSLKPGLLESWYTHPKLQTYRLHLEDILRAKPHTLSLPEERLLAMASEALGTTTQVFAMLNNLDIPEYFGKIKDEAGEEHSITHSAYQKLLQSPWPDVRRDAFQTYFQEFGKHRNTLAANLDGKVKAHVFQARARNHPSARHAALFGDNVSTDVYDSLIDAMHARLPDFYRYMGLRKKVLALDPMHVFDISTPIVADLDLKYTWEEAEALMIDSLAPLGDEYIRLLRQGLNDRWVDRYENKGKRSGAYSSGCYDSMPYVLHNYNGTLNSVFTLAHELGHSMHSALTNAHQPYHTSHYRIFVAEVASTTNEALLMHFMLQKAEDPKLRAYLLNQSLNDFRTTMFRQTMFAEFERDIHAASEEGKALTCDFLDEHYYTLTKKYYGDHIAWDDADKPISWEWCRVPHFYYNFYVYKYATGMAAATSLARHILHEGEPAVSRYLHFLKAGNSGYPLDLLQDAGVDLTTSAPVEDALATFSETLDQLETLLG